MLYRRAYTVLLKTNNWLKGYEQADASVVTFVRECRCVDHNLLTVFSRQSAALQSCPPSE